MRLFRWALAPSETSGFVRALCYDVFQDALFCSSLSRTSRARNSWERKDCSARLEVLPRSAQEASTSLRSLLWAQGTLFQGTTGSWLGPPGTREEVCPVLHLDPEAWFLVARVLLCHAKGSPWPLCPLANPHRAFWPIETVPGGDSSVGCLWIMAQAWCGEAEWIQHWKISVN